MPDGAPSSVTTSMSAASIPVIRCIWREGFEIVALQETNITRLSVWMEFVRLSGTVLC
jgi:hypothetical protein